jgi:uncharacterized membrane protein YqhA
MIRCTRKNSSSASRKIVELNAKENLMMFHKILLSSRFFIVIAVIGSFLASLASLVYGGIKSVSVIISLFQRGLLEKSTKSVAVSFIELIDLFLIGTVFYIVALGLYELFIDEKLELPTWLVIRNLDDLKMKMINGIVVIMAVYFLGELVEWDGQTDLLGLSISIALIIAALTFFQSTNSKKTDH